MIHIALNARKLRVIAGNHITDDVGVEVVVRRCLVRGQIVSGIELTTVQDAIECIAAVSDVESAFEVLPVTISGNLVSGLKKCN